MKKTNQTFKYNKELWTQNSVGSRSEIFFKLRQIKIHEMLLGLARPRPASFTTAIQIEFSSFQYICFLLYQIELMKERNMGSCMRGEQCDILQVQFQRKIRIRKKFVAGNCFLIFSNKANNYSKIRGSWTKFRFKVTLKRYGDTKCLLPWTTRRRMMSPNSRNPYPYPYPYPHPLP